MGIFLWKLFTMENSVDQRWGKVVIISQGDRNFKHTKHEPICLCMKTFL